MRELNHNILEVEHLKTYFQGSRNIFSGFSGNSVVKAVDDVSFSVERGETFGIVGESGCGKSTLGRSVIRLINPTEGITRFEQVNLSTLSREQLRLMRKDMQIVFQDPYASLNPRMTVKELIKAPLDVFEAGDEAVKMDKVIKIMSLVGLRKEFMHKYPHEFSGGQRQRIVIARALILNPKFVFCDEPVSALDVSVRAQVLNLMKDIQQTMGLTYLFISHDLGVVKFLCNHVAVMYLGKFVELASKEQLFTEPKHPYSKALISAIPSFDISNRKQRIVLKGEVPSPYNPPQGCYFNTRCPYAMDICRHTAPSLKEICKGHSVACHLYN